MPQDHPHIMRSAVAPIASRPPHNVRRRRLLARQIRADMGRARPSSSRLTSMGTPPITQHPPTARSKLVVLCSRLPQERLQRVGISERSVADQVASRLGQHVAGEFGGGIHVHRCTYLERRGELGITHHFGKRHDGGGWIDP